MVASAKETVERTGIGLLSRRFVNAATVTALLGALTLLMVHLIPRYRPDGPDLVPWVVRGHLAHQWLGWGAVSVTGADSITLQNDSPKRSTVLHLSVPAPKTHIIHVSGTFETKGISAGSLPWQRARCFLLARSAKGKWHWAFPGLVFSNAHDGAVSVSFVAVVPPDITDIQVNLGLYHTTGSLTTRGVSVRAGRETIAFLFWRGVLLFAWMIWGVAVLGRLWRTPAPFVALPAVLLVSALLLMPESTEQALTQGFSHGVDMLLKGTDASAENNVALQPTRIETERDVEHMLPPTFRLDRATHVTIFAFLTLLLIWLNRRNVIVEPAAYLVLFAGSSEILQHYTPGRTPDMADFGLNVAGIALGVAMVLLAMWADNRLRSSPEEGALANGPSGSG